MTQSGDEGEDGGGGGGGREEEGSLNSVKQLFIRNSS